MQVWWDWPGYLFIGGGAATLCTFGDRLSPGRILATASAAGQARWEQLAAFRRNAYAKLLLHLPKFSRATSSFHSPTSPGVSNVPVFSALPSLCRRRRRCCAPRAAQCLISPRGRWQSGRPCGARRGTTKTTRRARSYPTTARTSRSTSSSWRCCTALVSTCSERRRGSRGIALRASRADRERCFWGRLGARCSCRAGLLDPLLGSWAVMYFYD